MAVSKGRFAGDVDAHFELDVAEPFLQGLEFSINGGELFGEPAELAAAFYDPDEADVTRDCASWCLEERCLRRSAVSLFVPALYQIAEQWHAKCTSGASCQKNNTVELTEWPQSAVRAFDGYRSVFR